MNRSVEAALHFAPPGHYYSPHPDLEEVEAAAGRLFAPRVADTLPGIELNAVGQLALSARFTRFYDDLPWGDEARAGLRYFMGNDFFCQGDGLVLYSVLRAFRPRRIVEIGSGFSSAAMLDVIERFLSHDCELTCVEPYAERLRACLRPGDEAGRLTIIERNLQDVDAALFEPLEANDIFFVDSSHVSKIGSDVNHVLFDLLPRLRPGVIIHFHDIFYPFEYPRDWVLAGRAWNEAYLLRAFLQFNPAFEVLFFNSFLDRCHHAEITAALPLFGRNPGGSLWLRKLA